MKAANPKEAMELILKIAAKSGIEPNSEDQDILMGLCERYFYGSPQEKMKCVQEALAALNRRQDIGPDGTKLMKGISGPAKKEFEKFQTRVFDASGISEGNPFR